MWPENQQVAGNATLWELFATFWNIGSAFIFDWQRCQNWPSVPLVALTQTVNLFSDKKTSFPGGYDEFDQQVRAHVRGKRACFDGRRPRPAGKCGGGHRYRLPRGF